MKEQKWVIEQTWQHLVFLHFSVPVIELQKLTPFPLDLFEGDAILSIVPFKMTDIRFPFTPKLPFFGKLWELNLRTYVKVGNTKGIYFFTLETDNWLSEKIARTFFHLPYHYSKIEASVKENSYKFKHHRENFDFELKGLIGAIKEKTEFDIWTSERYHLFCCDKNQTYRGDTLHVPWVLREFEPQMINDNFSKLLEEKSLPGLVLENQLSPSYCEIMKVRFKPFLKM